MEIAQVLEVPLKSSELAVSHRVGKKHETRPVARITNYQVRHELIKASRNLADTKDFETVSVNQELTKVRANWPTSAGNSSAKNLLK